MKRLLLASILLFPVMMACKASGPAQGQPTTQPAANQVTAASSGAGTGSVLAKINGIEVSDAEVSALVKKRLQKVESQIFDIKRDGLDEIIDDKLVEAEAKKRSISVEDLLKKELTIEQPTEQELQTFYSMMKSRFEGRSFDDVKPQLTAQIRNQKSRDLREQFIGKLRKEANIEVLMERPRIEVSVDDDPVKGPKDAPITIVEFSEFQCPYCHKARAVVNKILATYKDKVRYTFRDFPLSFHKNAPKAAEAAHCAGDQGKYWEYNDYLFEHQKELEPEDLKNHAKALKLNGDKFESCLESNKYTAEVEKDMNDGMAAGVSGTPAYFINGIFISGAQPFENFQKIIEEEITRLKL